LQRSPVNVGPVVGEQARVAVNNFSSTGRRLTAMSRRLVKSRF
jgi:hypothetical protein